MSEQNRSSNAASGALSRQTLISLGDIVHNEAEVARLRRLGLRTVDERTDISTLAANRAHPIIPGEVHGADERTDISTLAANCTHFILPSEAHGADERSLPAGAGKAPAEVFDGCRPAVFDGCRPAVFDGGRPAVFDGCRPAVLIRAHGEPPATYEAARRAGITLVDATCPVVAALQLTVSQAFSEMSAIGGQVVIFGRRGHAEVRGLLGQTTAKRGGGSADGGGGMADVVVVECEADLAAVDFSRPIYFLAQTTSSLEWFRALADEIRRRAADVCGATDGTAGADSSTAQVVVRDTICRQVADREAAIGDFARRHDVVIFVAGEKSSNGQVLFDAVRRANPRSHKVVAISDLTDDWFADAASIGVCGATSTPRWLMEEIAAKLKT